MIKWSFSSLKQYVKCPRQYHEIKVLQNYQVKVTEQMQYGTEVHKALEEYTRDGKELPSNYRKFKTMVDALLAIGGDKYIEHKMALREDHSPCDFDASDYWVRGIADLLIVDKDIAFIVDYKTGSNKYPDTDQLKLMALMVFKHFPDVVRVKAGLMFVAHNSFLSEEYVRDRERTYWGAFTAPLMRLKISFDTANWPPNPSPLCKWCSVDSCNFRRE
jgi:ATP-dependent exoDNAse (exonuclease V) beta subunit